MNRTKTKNRTGIRYDVKQQKLIVNIAEPDLHDYKIELLNVTGKILYQLNYENRDYVCEHIDLTNISKGMIYFKITVDNEPVVKELIYNKSTDSHFV